MPEQPIKILPAGEGLQLWLYQSTEIEGGAYLSLRHSTKTRGVAQGEVLIAAPQVPDLVRALTEAAAALSARGLYAAGFDDGQRTLADALRKHR